MITMRQIAKEAGVSLATVSRAFNEPEKLSPDTCAKVMEAKRRLEIGKSNADNMIGVLVPHLSNPFFYEVLRHIDLRLRGQNYTPLSILSNNASNMKNDIEKLCLAGVKALLLMPPIENDDISEDWLHSLGIPVVQVFNHVFPSFDSVSMNDERGGYIAAQNLLGYGHRRILYIGVYGDHWRGFVRAHEEMGIPISEKDAMFIHAMRDQVIAIRDRIQRQRPTALFTHTEFVTLETLQACAQLKLDIPRDVSLIAYDEYPWMTMSGISVISHPMSGLAENVCQVALGRLSSNTISDPIHLVMEPRMITRRSIGVCRE